MGDREREGLRRRRERRRGTEVRGRRRGTGNERGWRKQIRNEQEGVEEGQGLEWERVV